MSDTPTPPASLSAVLTSPLLSCEGIVHGFSTRNGGVSRVYRPLADTGDLNLGFTAQDAPGNVRENRRRFLGMLNAKHFARFALLRQKHTPDIQVIGSHEDGAADFLEPAFAEGDGLMTNVPGVLLTIQTADCIPVLLFDPRKRAVAAFHAGWRGTVQRIVERGTALMQARYGVDPADTLAAIGPGIGPASYTVGEEVRQAFAPSVEYAESLFQGGADGSALRLDLWEANRRQLLTAGVPSEQIHVLGEDTATQTDRFFSHRAERGFTGRMMSAIGLKA